MKSTETKVLIVCVFVGLVIFFYLQSQPHKSAHIFQDLSSINQPSGFYDLAPSSENPSSNRHQPTEFIVGHFVAINHRPTGQYLTITDMHDTQQSFPLDEQVKYYQYQNDQFSKINVTDIHPGDKLAAYPITRQSQTTIWQVIKY